MRTPLYFSNRILMPLEHNLACPTHSPGLSAHLHHPTVPHFRSLVHSRTCQDHGPILVPIYTQDFRHRRWDSERGSGEWMRECVRAGLVRW
jgi:hypothetical protein